jgi:hypothetical protein
MADQADLAVPRWDDFVRWAHRMAGSYDLVADERTYKLAFAERLAAVRERLLAHEPWVDELAAALPSTNLLHFRWATTLVSWCRAEPEPAAAAFRQIWDADADDDQAVEQFTDRLPADLRGAGGRAHLASVLRLAVAPERCPVVRPTPFTTAYKLVGIARTGPVTAVSSYRDGVAFCDRLIAEAAAHGMTIADRLDAQGVIEAVTAYGPHDSWPDDERRAFLDYRGGTVSPEFDVIAELVQMFHQETGYPRESDLRREQERRELAEALTAEALADPDVAALRRLAGPAYGSPGNQPGFNRLLQAPDTTARLGRWLTDLLHGDGPLADRITAALSDADGLPGVKEAMVTKALAVQKPEQWLPNYVTEGRVGKRRVLELLGLPASPPDLSRAEAMIDSNGRIRAVLEPYCPGDAWGMLQLCWWLLKTEAAEPPGDESDPVDALAESMTFPRHFVDKVLRAVEHKKQVVFYGPPGTGKTLFARRLAEHLARGGGAVRTVQFHPSYSYEDFVEGLRPQTSEGGQLTYQVVPGPLKTIALEAAANLDVTHVLIVDELNRAPVSKVLGELYYLLEYRDTDLLLQYSQEPFRLPGNLVILATMNTADRSVALVDAALRRRFHFIALYPDQEPIEGLLARFLDKHGLDGELGWLPGVVDRANRLVLDRHDPG